MARALETRHGGGSDRETGFFGRLRMWLDAFQADAADRHPADAAPAAPARVLDFPLRRDALLVELAVLLKGRIAHNPRRELFELTLVRAPWLQLRLDPGSYVEYHPGQATYRLVVALGPATDLTIETAEFDQVVAFVVEYVNDRLADAAGRGEAP